MVLREGKQTAQALQTARLLAFLWSFNTDLCCGNDHGWWPWSLVMNCDLCQTDQNFELVSTVTPREACRSINAHLKNGSFQGAPSLYEYVIVVSRIFSDQPL